MNCFKRPISYLEMAFAGAVLVFIFFPIKIPDMLGDWIDSNLGLSLIIISSIVVMYYRHPIITGMYVIAMFELLRRSSYAANHLNIQTQDQITKDEVMVEMNPIQHTTLEEHIISVRAPVGTATNVISVQPFEPAHNSLGGGAFNYIQQE